MAAGCLKCCQILCCCFIVVTNVVMIVTGLVLVALGALFTWGLNLLGSALDSTLSGLFDSITSSLKTSIGFDLNILGLLRNINTVTGTMGIVFLILGVLLIVFACVGAWGACCTVKPCLIVYAVAVLLAFLAQLIIVIIWFANADLLKSSVKTTMVQSMEKYEGTTSSNIQSLLINLIQIFVGCCGVNNGSDFATMSPSWTKQYNYTYLNYTYTLNLTYPISCCKFNLTTFSPKDEFCMYNNTTPETNNYQVGCYAEIFNFIEKYFALDSLFYALAGCLLFQLLLGAGAIIIIHADRKQNSVKPQ